MMQKLVPAGSWSRLADPPVARIPISSRGLLGEDYRRFVKRASHSLADHAARIEWKPGEVPVHVIAVCAYPVWGPNRNGDAFRADACRRYHDTFVKHARYYHNHQNKDPAKSYGVVKLSAFNEPMQRIELILAVNATPEAAQRNGGLVEHPDVLDKLDRNELIHVSMSCRVPFDECSICHHKAASRAEYCTADRCPGGGCKENLGRVLDDGRQVFVYNDYPEFFDISLVARPAERTASGGRIDYLEKVSESRVVGGAELADLLEISVPDRLLTASERYGVSRRSLLLDLERRGAEIAKRAWHVRGLLPELCREDWPSLHPREVPGMLAALAERKVMVPASVFASWHRIPEPRLPIVHWTKAAEWTPLSAARPSDVQVALARRLAERYSFQSPVLAVRGCLAPRREPVPPVKWASEGSACEAAYAGYQASWLEEWGAPASLRDLVLLFNQYQAAAKNS